MKRTLLVILSLIAIVLVAVVIVHKPEPSVTEGAEAVPARKSAIKEFAPALRESSSAPSKSLTPKASPVQASVRPNLTARPSPMSVSARIPRAKALLIALFAVKPGEMPPALPELTHEERNLLPMLIENELTDADGCDAEAIRREFHRYMERGGLHSDFLPDYHRKLMP